MMMNWLKHGRDVGFDESSYRIAGDEPLLDPQYR